MAEATEPCTPETCLGCARLAECREDDGNVGRGIRIALLVSMALWALGYALVTAVLRGCR